MSWLGFLGLGGTGYEKHQEYPERITEAACDDLVQSLMRLGFIPKMIPSLDGKEYWTSEHLGQMIVARLAKLGGRLSILELPRMLNVELSSARDVIQDLLRSQPGKFVQVQEDLLEIDYLVNITREMNSELDQRGFLTTVEQSKRYNLGLDYMRQFLKDRVGSQIHGTWDTVDQGFVYAGWFKTQQKAALLKLLCELDEPTTLATLRARRVVHDQFFFGLCDALVKEEASALPGTIKGWHDQGIFVPRQFVKHQASSIESFFDQNGFIAFESVTKHGVSDPKNYIRKLRPNALLLETHAVQESIWSVVDASVEDAITSVSWVDIKPLLPSPLTKGDLASLLAQLPSLTHPHSRPSPPATDRDDGGEGVTGFGGVGSPYDTFILQDRAVLTSGQIQKCMLEMGPLLDNTLKAVMSWRLSFGSLGLVLDDHVEENSEAGSGGGVTSSDQHREQIQQVISQKGRKDRIKMVSPSLSKSKGKGSSSDLLVGSGGSATNQKKKRLDDFLTLADIIAELKTTEPDLEPMLAEAIARALHRPLLLQLKEKNRHLVIDQAEERGIDEPAEQHSGDIVNKQATKLLEHILQTLDKIAAFAKGVELFEDSSAMNSLSKYLLQSICSELLPLYILLISYTSLPSDQAANSLQERLLQQYWTSSSNISEPSAQHQPPQPFTIEGADLVALEQVLPPPQMDMAKKWRKCVTGSGKWKSLDELCKTLQVRPITVFEQERQQKDHGETSSSTSASSPSSSGPLSSFSDRKPKILRTHLDDLRATLIDLDQVASKALLVHVVTLIVFQAWTGEMLHASGKYVPRILKQLHVTVAATSTTEGKEENAKDERGEALAKLEQLMQVVMEEVKSGGAVTSTEDATTLCQSIFDYGLRMTSRG